MANSSSQRFCLRWNNHQSNLLSVFDQLLHDESFVDVTLAVEGRFIRAHKMVLSACSPYFQSLLIGHPDKHPIVIMKDIPFIDMRCLLDFMYRGEVSVDQDRLTAFLKVAESLRIKGLTEVNEDRCDLPTLTNSLLSQQMHGHIPPPQLHRIQQPSVKRPNFPLINSAPLLGSALTAPKRKRGRPRKLSGSSDFGPGSPNSDTDASDAKASECILPEMLCTVKSEKDDEKRESSCDRQSTEDDREKMREVDGATGMAGTSHTPNRGNGIDTDGYSIEKLLQAKLERRSSDESTSNLVIDFNTKQIKREVSSPFSSGSTNTSLNTSGEGVGLGLPYQVRRNVQTRRIRRRANSSSQDPAEHLTEMSVRDKNLDTETSSTSFEQITEASIVIKTEFDPDLLIQQADEEADLENGKPALYFSIIDNDEVHYDSTSPNAGLHFLSDETYGTDKETQDSINEIIDNLPKERSDLLEYLVRYDKTVVCKLCGEVLPSRTHWYRHKYKLHVPSAGLPAGLIKCNKCNTFFKSRKGYVGHCVTRHGSVEEAEKEEEEVVLTQFKPLQLVFEEEVEDIETTKMEYGRGRRRLKDEQHEDYLRQREREEKLVADIIAKVKKECEAQSITIGRRGYSRRSTVMTSFKEYDKRK